MDDVLPALGRGGEWDEGRARPRAGRKVLLILFLLLILSVDCFIDFRNYFVCFTRVFRKIFFAENYLTGFLRSISV